jgi:hypothetical protein
MSSLSIRRRTVVALALVLAGLGLSPRLPAQEHAAVDAGALAKQTQNPVADLVAIPFQGNFNSGGDLEQKTFFNLNVQPAIPFSLSRSWNLISRTIVPLDSIPTPDGKRHTGVGDIQEQLLFTPAKPGRLIWGFGPVFSLPTATAAPVETGSWAIGPGLVLVKSTGPWVLGVLITQYWNFSDEGGDPKTNLLAVQPFVNLNFGKGWALAFVPLMTANWDADPGNQWTVPLGLGINRTTVFNRRPMTLGVQYYYNVARPDGSAGGQLRFLVSLLYPKPPKPPGR